MRSEGFISCNICDEILTLERATLALFRINLCARSKNHIPESKKALFLMYVPQEAPSPQNKNTASAPEKQSLNERPFTPALALDAEGNVKRLTDAARRLLEYRPGQNFDPCFFTHVHGKNLYQVMRDVADMVCYGKEKASWLFRLRTGQGRWRWYRATVTNQLDPPDPAITVTLRDLYDWS